MKKLSCIAAVAAAIMLVSLPVAPVLAENAPTTRVAPSTATTPAPAAAPAASPAVTTTTPAATTPATTTEPAKGSKKKNAAKIARHNAAPKPYLHLVPLEKMF